MSELLANEMGKRQEATRRVAELEAEVARLEAALQRCEGAEHALSMVIIAEDHDE